MTPVARAVATMLCGALCVASAACSSGGSDDRVPAPTPTPSSARPSSIAEPTPAAQDAPVVLAVSIDGLNPDALDLLADDDLPSLRRLINEGASTLDARTAYELTVTLPNHTGMMTGRTIDGPRGTSVTFNDDNGSTLDQVHGSAVPGMFDVAHDRGVRTALFAEKDKFRFLVRSWDAGHGAPDVTGEDDGRDKIDTADIAPAGELVDDVLGAMRGDGPALVFWHLAGPDVAGHANGWLTPAYLRAVREADRRIGEILAGLDADPALSARTTILLTADHGGPRDARDHGDAAAPANYRIPFIARGRGVAAGVDLYALDTTRRDPGAGRPGYEGAQPIRNLDLADTALGLLGLPGLPDAQGSPVATR